MLENNENSSQLVVNRGISNVKQRKKKRVKREKINV